MKAAQNVSTIKPLIIVPRYQKTAPFTTSENKPKVIILIGKVKIFIIGFKNMLKRVKQAPTTKTTQRGSTNTPATNCVVSQTEIDIKIQCKIIFIPLEAGRDCYIYDTCLISYNK